MAGADLIMPDRFLQPEPLVRLIEAERPTLAGAVPTIWNVLLPARARARRRPLARCGWCRAAARRCRTRCMEAYQKELGRPDRPGLGDDRDLAARQRGAPARRAPEDEAWRYRDTAGPAHVRRSRPGWSATDGTVLPHDGEAVGEIEVRGPWVTGSYYKDDDPAKFHDGWLRTGDVGTIDRLGFVTLTDRAKDVIKSGGEWISSMELENALMAHPAVAEAAVIGVPDDKWGERPLAAVVLGRGASVTAGGAAGLPGRARCRAGSCPSAGRSSPRCPRPASASSPRPGSARRTPGRLRGDRGSLSARPAFRAVRSRVHGGTGNCFAGAATVPVP